jgi:hypothetical protein
MARLWRFLVIGIMLAGLLLLPTEITRVTSQPNEELQPQFNKALALVHEAEGAGATREEVADLVVLMNKALQLNEEAAALPESEAKRKVDLLAQVNATLAIVETEAGQLEVIAARRTFTNQVLAYLSGGIGAFASTLAYVIGVRFWRTYRVKRTFQMRISRKRVEPSALSK